MCCVLGPRAESNRQRGESALTATCLVVCHHMGVGVWSRQLVGEHGGCVDKRGARASAVGGVGPDERGCRACGDKSSEPRLNLSGSWQQGHSAAYNTPFLIQVVCKGFIARGQEIVMAHGSCDTVAHGFPRAVDRFPSGMDSNLEAFSYNPAHGSFAASPFPAAAIPMVRIGGSSRTEPNYRWARNSSRVKLTCLTTV